MFKFVSSVHLAVILLILLIISCILGTVIVQSSGLTITDTNELGNFYNSRYGKVLGTIIYKLDFHMN